MSKMEQVLESINSDVLTDEVKQSILEAFNTEVNEAVEQRINERVELRLNEYAEKIDEDHTNQVKQMLEAIDTTHTKMFKDVINKVDASHTKKLQTVVEKFQKELNENAVEFKESLVSKVSKFLDLKIDEMVPKQQLAEAVENIQARKLISEMKKLLSYDPESVNDEVKTALKEGYDAIEALKKEVNEKAKENLVLQEQVNEIKTRVLLESKTRDLTESKRNFVYKFMEGKTPDYVKNNFDYVVEMFEENERSEQEVLVEDAKQNSVSKSVSVPPSQIKDEVITESSSTGDDVFDYLSQMKQQDTFYK